jgi:uncharacterized membrane protein
MKQIEQVKEQIEKIHENRGMIAALTYFVFFLPRFTKHRADLEVQYHMKQSIGLLITALSLQGAISILIGYWGMPKAMGIWPVRIFLLYLLITGIQHALKMKQKQLPVIGKYAERVF